jgi:DNA-binding transcriptional LysR family regulator
MAPDLNAAAIFGKVVELRSFRAAALALALPRSTVSARVAKLEAELGARLLERTTRSVRVTEAGSVLLQQIGPALEAVNEGFRAVAGLQTEPSGSIRLVAPAELNGPPLSDALVDYARRHPRVQLHVELTDRVVDLVNEGFDLALRAGVVPDSTLIDRKLGPPQRLLTYASEAYLRRRGTPRRPADLTRHDCLVMTAHREGAAWTYFVRNKAVRVRVRPRLTANSFGLVRALAEEGLGITRVPEALARSAGRGLRVVLEDCAPPPRHWHVLYPSARHLSVKVRSLIDVLHARFAMG